MFAVISDIHSNIEALTTVLDDIENRGIKTIYCLGDVVGYGPNPRECLDLIIKKTKLCVLGNHDYAVFYEPTNFNYGAEQASFWTRFVLEAEEQKETRNTRWEFLGRLPLRRTIKTFRNYNLKIPLDQDQLNPASYLSTWMKALKPLTSISFPAKRSRAFRSSPPILNSKPTLSW